MGCLWGGGDPGNPTAGPGLCCSTFTAHSWPDLGLPRPAPHSEVAHTVLPSLQRLIGFTIHGKYSQNGCLATSNVEGEAEAQNSLLCSSIWDWGRRTGHSAPRAPGSALEAETILGVVAMNWGHSKMMPTSLTQPHGLHYVGGLPSGVAASRRRSTTPKWQVVDR